MTEPKPIYSGEAVLLSWGESHRDGRVIRLKIEEDGTHPFKGLETGANGGQRFMIVVVPINNDNTPAEAVSESTKNGDGKSKPNIRLAMALARDPEFQRYCHSYSEESALGYIKASCGVTSRTQLDDDGPARALRVVQTDFNRWRQEPRQ